MRDGCLRASDRCGRIGRKTRRDHTLEFDLGGDFDTALTRDVAIEMGADGLPNTFVPAAPGVLTFAAALAYRRGIAAIIGGMCETDIPAIRIAATRPSSAERGAQSGMTDSSNCIRR